MKKTTLGAFFEQNKICSFKLKSSLKMHKNARKCTRMQESMKECNESIVKMQKSARKSRWV